MSEEQKVIKRFDSVTCPHCNKDMYVGTQFMLPTPTTVITQEAMEKARQEVITRLDEIKFVNLEDKNEILKYLETALLDYSDIEPILHQIATEQVRKELELKKK